MFGGRFKSCLTMFRCLGNISRLLDTWLLFQRLCNVVGCSEDHLKYRWRIVSKVTCYDYLLINPKLEICLHKYSDETTFL